MFNCNMESPSRNYISLLNEYLQMGTWTVEYEEGSTEGPSHDPTYGNIIYSINIGHFRMFVNNRHRDTSGWQNASGFY